MIQRNAIKKLSELTRQFVNILTIRSVNTYEGFTSLNDLLAKYQSDKQEIKGALEKGDKLDACTEDNLYYKVLTDLQNFVSFPKMDPEGNLYVGIGEEANEKYAYIPPNSILYFKDQDGNEQKARYNPSAERSVADWAKKINKDKGKKSPAVNIFITVKIADTDDLQLIRTVDKFRKIPKIHLDDYKARYNKIYGEDNSPKLAPTIRITEAIESRLSDKSVKILYTNYVESFLHKMEEKSPPIKYLNQTGGGQVSSDKRYNAILQVIDDYLVPSDVARKQRGEVFTPPDLVRKMLYGLKKGTQEIWGFDGKKFYDDEDENRYGGLPESVWSNPDLKWLDPANGIGNFPIIAYYKLDYYLSKVNGYKDADTRRKHIIEKMLYMMELDSGNNATCRGLFKKIYKDAKPNILCCNSLEITYEQIKTKFRVDKFDVIIGNPPYNPPKTETGSSGNSIWQNFVIKFFMILEDKGYLLFVHPPGWKKPTDEIFKPDNFAEGNYIGQIRQGQVWQFLKEYGVFKFIYTNDQKSKAVEYIEHFPAVDYYVYQKGGDKSGCDTNNVFLGTIDGSKGVRLNYNLKYLPNLITKQTQDILHMVTSKEGDKPDFSRGIDERGITWSGKNIDWLYDSNKSGFQYKKHGINAFTKSGKEKEDTVNIDKVVVNFGGGIDAYNVKYIQKGDENGVLDMTMYSKVKPDKDGKTLEEFFKSDIVKFIFLITQYASGKMTKNEPLVANSLTIPPKGTTNYYKFFFEDKAEEYKVYIEKILAHYEQFKAPKREAKTEKAKKGGSRRPHRFTRRKSRS